MKIETQTNKNNDATKLTPSDPEWYTPKGIRRRLAEMGCDPLHEIWKIAEDKETPSRLRVQAYKTLA